MKAPPNVSVAPPPTPKLAAASSQNASARANPARRRTGGLLRGLRLASYLNLVAVLGVWALIGVVSEDWWVSAALVYLPRIAWLAPSLILLPVGLFADHRSAVATLLAIGVVAGPVMELRIADPMSVSAVDLRRSLRIVSCNVQSGMPDTSKVLAEIEAIAPDVIAVQESYRGGPLIRARYPDWHHVHITEYEVFSRYPIELTEHIRSPDGKRITAMAAVMQTPFGPVRLVNVHQSTARYGLTGLKWHSLFSAAGVNRLKERQAERELEAQLTAQFAMSELELPTIAVGDFNMPSSSSFYAPWSVLQNAFDEQGIGYGYTSPCDDEGRWPANTPWLRIDHILCSAHWSIESCRIGTSDGSDHRLVTAELRLLTPGF